MTDLVKWSVYVCANEKSDVDDWEILHDVDFVEWKSDVCPELDDVDVNVSESGDGNVEVVVGQGLEVEDDLELVEVLELVVVQPVE